MVKSGDVVRPGHDGDRLGAGDRLRFRYDTGGLPYVLIVGVDSDGVVFPYVADGNQSHRALAGVDYAADAVELDADVRPERMFALYSREPINLEAVKPAARQGLATAGSIQALVTIPGFSEPGAMGQATVLINKQGAASHAGSGQKSP
jgi:hypothetical protein